MAILCQGQVITSDLPEFYQKACLVKQVLKLPVHDSLIFAILFFFFHILQVTVFSKANGQLTWQASSLLAINLWFTDVGKVIWCFPKSPDTNSSLAEVLHFNQKAHRSVPNAWPWISNVQCQCIVQYSVSEEQGCLGILLLILVTQVTQNAYSVTSKRTIFRRQFRSNLTLFTSSDWFFFSFFNWLLNELCYSN